MSASMNVDIAEQICQAIDSIVGERLKSIKYDTTIIATIENNKDAKDYKYICSNGSTEFVAFSKDTTYKVGETVQVTIPNNDYDQQKIIIGKYVAKNSTPFAYVQPFDTFIDVSANVVNTTKELSLLANDGVVVIPDPNDDNKKIAENVFTKAEILYGISFKEGYKGFNRMGVKGQFRSWLSELKTIKGDYGYRVDLFSSNGALLNEAQELDLYHYALLNIYTNNEKDIRPSLYNFPDDWFTALGEGRTKTQFINSFNGNEGLIEKQEKLLPLIKSKFKLTSLYLSSEEMYGNPFNFQNFYEQEKVYDISKLGTIYGLVLYFYEKTGSFYDELNTPIPYQFSGGGPRPNNLFTKDAYICFGYDLSGFSEEQAILYSLSGETFDANNDNITDKENEKIIRLRWLHEFEDDQIKVVNESTQLDDDYEIRWYRYQLGAKQADEYSGVYWVQVNPSNVSQFTYILNPKPNVEREQIKAIILYKDKVIESNIITFTMQNPDGVVNQATAKVLSGLSIWCKDNSYGNYFIYGQNNEILESPTLSANTILTLEARFADATILSTEDNVDEKSPPLESAKSITWTFPLRNTMIVVDGINYNPDLPKNQNEKKNWKLPGFYNDADVEGDEENGLIKITRYGDENNGYKINATQNYLIQNFYNSSAINNTVLCEIEKNSMKPSTSKEFNFGIRGTTGTDVTLVINFDNNKTAFTADPYINDEADTTEIYQTLSLTARLFDSSYKEIDFNDEQYSHLGCSWSWECYHEDVEGSYLDSNSKKYEIVSQELNNKQTSLNEVINTLNQQLKEKENNEVYQDYLKLLEKQKTETLTEDEEKQFNSLIEELDSAFNEIARINEQIKETESSKKEVEDLYSALTDSEIEFTEAHSRQLDYSYLDQAISKNGDIKIQSQNKNTCIIGLNQGVTKLDLNKNYFHIIKFTITGWGDYPELVAYKAIPIRHDQRFRNIIGPVNITYDTKGEIYYNKVPYELYGCENKKDIEVSVDVVINDSSPLSLDGVTWMRYNPYNEKLDLIGSFGTTKNILQPCALYTKDTKPYGVKAYKTFYKKDEDGQLIKDENGNLIVEEQILAWIQPLVITQNKYPSATINSWNGKGIEIDDKSGTIVAPAIAAGKKHLEDNTFSGVMIGDWKDAEKSVSAMTGVYGFNHGAQSFAFKEDGTAFIGKSGHGRILFDGNKGILKSSKWDKNPSEGMLLDLDDGILDMKVNNKFITLSASEKRWPLSIGNVQSVSSRDFRVDWDGYLRANNATISGTIYADSGTLGSLDVEGTLDCSEGTILGATIMGGTISGAEIYFGSGQFYVYEGTLSTGEVRVLKLKEEKKSPFQKKIDNEWVTFEYKETQSATNAGRLLYGPGSYTFADGSKEESGVLLLDATASTSLEESSSLASLPIVVRSDDRVLIYSTNSWVMLQTKTAKIKVSIPDGDITLEANNIRIEGEAANKPENQHNIYARFA